MSDTHRVAALVLRVDGSLRFVPAAVALRVAPPPRVTPVPGAPSSLVGVTLHRGTIIPVISIGAVRREMVVCQHGVEIFGLIGAEVVCAGSFNASPENPQRVELEREHVEPLDVVALYAQVQSSTRPGRWGN
ncbi:MAG: chemotaxis protein CheW [Myxococcota bacterium]|nr:chemotaxis protein CheW [Myxococcota bacterium]